MTEPCYILPQNQRLGLKIIQVVFSFVSIVVSNCLVHGYDSPQHREPVLDSWWCLIIIDTYFVAPWCLSFDRTMNVLICYKHNSAITQSNYNCVTAVIRSRMPVELDELISGTFCPDTFRITSGWGMRRRGVSWVVWTKRDPIFILAHLPLLPLVEEHKFSIKLFPGNFSSSYSFSNICCQKNNFQICDR